MEMVDEKNEGKDKINQINSSDVRLYLYLSK